MSTVPEGYFYTEKHEWAREENGTLLVGITHYAQEALGDIVYIECQPVETELGQGDSFGTIESVKAASDLYSPASGTILEVNETLNDDPAAVNRDPYGSWMIRVKDYEADDLKTLMDSAAYSEYLTTLVE